MIKHQIFFKNVLSTYSNAKTYGDRQAMIISLLVSLNTVINLTIVNFFYEIKLD